MNASQWEHAKEIFDAALDQPTEERSDFVRRACNGDATLQIEVEELLAADAGMGGFLKSGWLSDVLGEQPEFSLNNGDVISGRFRIVRPLGDGGMGRVYEAHDSELGVQVALKTLRPEIASNPEVLRRFRQEVRIAHRITHPNVSRIFHFDHEVRQVGADERNVIDLTFITMEYLNGETLQQMLKRTGRLSPDRALVIARQMADAIEAAHQTGVIHRDIKPGNVMICPAASGHTDDRVVVTDFGLAKFGAGAVDSDHSSISHAGHAKGTLAYMSPEQLKDSDVGGATDIYAFGLVLFEMVTGRKGFPDSGSLEAAFRRISDEPPSAKALVPNLPAEWQAAISGCLQIDPAARFQSACDVISVLDGGTVARPRPRVLQKPRALAAPTRRKFLAFGAALAVLVALLVAGLRLYSSRGDSTVAPGTLVYLAPVKNETGEKQLDNVTELVHAGLEQSAHINLLDAGKVGDTLQLMTKPPDAVIDAATAREIAMRAGAARVIFVSITGTGGTYHLDVDVQQPDYVPLSFRKHEQNSWTWRAAPNAVSSSTMSPDLLSNVREASSWVRHTVGESANDVAQLDAPPQDVTTASWDALAEYTHAQHLATRGDDPGAVIALRNAVQLDPQFALAYARLGDILFALRQSGEGLEAYKHALATGADRRLSRRERDRIKAMYAIDTHDYQAADMALRDSISFYENDPLSWAYRVKPLEMLGLPYEAVTSLKKVLETNPHSEFGLGELANTYLLMGENDQAAKAIEQVRAAGYVDLTMELEGHLQFLEGNLAAAETSFNGLSRAKDPEIRIRSLPLLARVSAERGDWRRALTWLDDAANVSEISSRPGVLASVLLDRALVWGRLGQPDAMIGDVKQALVLERSPANLSKASALLGQSIAFVQPAGRQAIQRALEALLSASPQPDEPLDAELARLRIVGEEKLARNDWEGALSVFRKAANLDAPAGAREYLGRALVIAAGRVQDPAARKLLEREAMQAYSLVALRPGFVWQHPTEWAPGFYGDQLEAFLRLDKKANPWPSDLSSEHATLRRLRGGSASPGVMGKSGVVLLNPKPITN